MLPTREEALKLICDGLLFNPGPWGKHCLTAAHCAEKIASAIYELYGYKLEIKKPNDLIFNGKKICGILTEIHTRGEKIEYLLISFGFNVNENEFSSETKEIATSLKKETGKDFKREKIICKIIEKLEEIGL